MNAINYYCKHAVAPERIWKWWGAPVRRFAPEKNFWSCPSTFLALKVQLVFLVIAFVMVSTVWPVSYLLFYSRCPRAQPFVKVETRALRVLRSRLHCKNAPLLRDRSTTSRHIKLISQENWQTVVWDGETHRGSLNFMPRHHCKVSPVFRSSEVFHAIYLRHCPPLAL